LVQEALREGGTANLIEKEKVNKEVQSTIRKQDAWGDKGVNRMKEKGQSRQKMKGNSSCLIPKRKRSITYHFWGESDRGSRKKTRILPVKGGGR